MSTLIIGCGYVGESLALLEKKRCSRVLGTTTRIERQEELQKLGIETVVWKSGDTQGLKDILNEKFDRICISIAPNNPSASYKDVYLKTANALFDILSAGKHLGHLIVVSSTSVYGDYEGDWVDETSQLRPNSEQDEVLIATEKCYLSLEAPVTIIRSGELVGPYRNPTDKLRKGFHGTPQSCTNLTHRDDLVLMITHSWEKGLTGIFNLCNDIHIPRQEYYQVLADIAEIDALVCNKHKWTSKRAPSNKKVSSLKALHHGFKYIFPLYPFKEGLSSSCSNRDISLSK